MNFCHIMKIALWGYRKSQVDQYVKNLLEKNNMELSEMLLRITELEDDKKQLELISLSQKRDLISYLDEILRSNQFTDIMESMYHREILHPVKVQINETSDKSEIKNSIEDIAEIIRKGFGNLSTKVDSLPSKIFVQIPASEPPIAELKPSGKDELTPLRIAAIGQYLNPEEEDEEAILKNEGENTQHPEAYDVSEDKRKVINISRFYEVLHSSISKKEASGESVNSFWGTALNNRPSLDAVNIGIQAQELMEHAKNTLDTPLYNSFFEKGPKPGQATVTIKDIPRFEQKKSHEDRETAQERKTEYKEERREAHQRREIDEDAIWIRQRYIVGKVVGEDLYDRNGRLIIARNSRITSQVVDDADKEGKLPELIVHMIME